MKKRILYLKKVRELLKKFTLVQVRHVPRVENTRPDALAKLTTTPQEDLNRLILVKHLPEPSVNIDGEEVPPVMSELSWMDPIWDYLVDGTLPIDPRRPPSSRRGRLDSPFIWEPYINDCFRYPSLNAWERKTPITCSKRCMKVSMATISEPGPWQQRH